MQNAAGYSVSLLGALGELGGSTDSSVSSAVKLPEFVPQ
jgi:hypothetical protein